MKVIRKDGLYIPIHKVSDLQKEEIKKFLEKDFFKDEKACESCDYFAERVCDVCETCPNYGGRLILHSQVIRGDNEYLRLPYGTRKFVKTLFDDDVTFVSKNKLTEVSAPYKFTGVLKPFQKKACEKTMKKLSGVLKSAPRTGKCIEGNSLIMSLKGIHPIKDLFDSYELNSKKSTSLNTENTIATSKGERQVEGLYTKIVDNTVLITTRDGYSIQGTPNHPVLILETDLSLAWKNLENVRKTDTLVISRKPQWLGKGNSLLKKANKTYKKIGDGSIVQEFPNKLTPELARLLGYWVANGALSLEGRLGITSNNKIIRDDFEYCLNKVFPSVATKQNLSKTRRVDSVEAHSKQVYRFLQDCCGLKTGVAKEKTVPKCLLNTDKQFILEFLGAYTSCDAWLHKNGLEFCSASKQLIDEIHVVLTYLGIVGRKSQISGSATNGLNIKRKYFKITLHTNETRNLIKIIPIKKQFELNSDNFVNQRDYIPNGKDFLGYISKKYQGETHKQWKKNNKFYSKQKVGILFERNKKGLRGNLYREKLKGFNFELLKWLDKEEFFKFKKVVCPDFYYSKISSIKKINKPTRVYDIWVPEGNHFVANGIVNHNTVMGAYIAAELGYKTLILAQQHEWLDNFKETFIGSETQKPLTNISKKKIGFARKIEDFKKYDVCLTTYQLFISPKGKKLLEKIKSMFPLVLIDEVQTANATVFASVVSKLEFERCYGLSGTPERKDQKEWIIDKLLGPIIHETKVERLTPRVVLTKTNFGGPMPKTWTYMVKKLEEDPDRLRIIARQAIKDVKDGHLVLIPFARVHVIRALTKAINREYGRKIAVSFDGARTKQDRKKIIDLAREFKVKIIVGNIKLLSTGVNIPRASCLYQVTPCSNIPKAEQRFSRILTPYEGKPEPIIRYFLDDVNVVKTCMRTEHWGCLVPMFRPSMTSQVKEFLAHYFGAKKHNDTKFTEVLGGVL